MGLADLHMHSRYSDGFPTVEEILEQARSRSLDAVAITDHDTLAGVEEAMRLSARAGVAVIPGVELSTRDGHLVALFVRRPIEPGLPLEDTLRLLREQGAVAFAPHLFERRLLHGMQAETIERLVKSKDPFRDVFLGVEVCGSGNLVRGTYTAEATALADRLGLAKLGSSDAHQLAAVGQYVTGFPGRTPDDLRRALLRRQTVGFLHQPVPDVQIWAGFALYYLRHIPDGKKWARAAGALALKFYDSSRRIWSRGI